MVISKRHAWVFAAGLAVGLLTGAGTLMGLQYADPGADKVFRAAVAEQPPPPKPQATAACMYDPVLPAAGERDGKFRMQADTSHATPADIPAYIAVGNDAAAQGRVRDAELALIISCRLAGQVAGAHSPELADAKFNLAQHYLKSVAAASSPQAKATFEDIRKRAEGLFSESIAGYGAKFGIEHDKTRQAAAGLAAIQAAVPVEHPGMADGTLPRPLLLAKVAEAQMLASDTSIMGAGPARKKVKATQPAEDATVAARPEAKPEAKPEKQESAKQEKQEKPEKQEPARQEMAERNVTDTSPSAERERGQPERKRPSESTPRREEPAPSMQVSRELGQAPRQATGSATGGAIGNSPDEGGF